jgi:hypothetical protein
MTIQILTSLEGRANVVGVLKAGRDLISEPSRWLQGGLAQDSEGKAVNPIDPSAVCWCSVGAVRKMAGIHQPLVGRRALDQLRLAATELGYFSDRELAWKRLDKINDNRTHPEVLAMWDQAIERAKQGVSE